MHEKKRKGFEKVFTCSGFENKTIVSYWKLSFLQRLQVLIIGAIYVETNDIFISPKKITTYDLLSEKYHNETLKLEIGDRKDRKEYIDETY